MEKSELPAFFAALHQKLYLIFSEHTLFTLVRENQHFLLILTQETALLVKYMLW
ncbi:UNVERIFIED_ORG: hypothetical protein BDK47_1138 [Anoxybacillus amylolyticus]